MERTTFDALARHAAAIPRRAGLRLLGGAVLMSAFAASTSKPANAAKAGAKARKRCLMQKGQCTAYFKELCPQTENPQDCEDLFLPCCEHLARCNAEAELECIFAAFTAG